MEPCSNIHRSERGKWICFRGNDVAFCEPHAKTETGPRINRQTVFTISIRSRPWRICVRRTEQGEDAEKAIESRNFIIVVQHARQVCTRSGGMFVVYESPAKRAKNCSRYFCLLFFPFCWSSSTRSWRRLVLAGV